MGMNVSIHLHYEDEWFFKSSSNVWMKKMDLCF
jgi:hypothetical protein